MNHESDINTHSYVVYEYSYKIDWNINLWVFIKLTSLNIKPALDELINDELNI